jgi:hypothetical protein
VSEFPRQNVERLLAYLTNLKETGHKEKFVMRVWLFDLNTCGAVNPNDNINWHCGTAGCLAGSWYIMLKQRGEDVIDDVENQFRDDFDLGDRTAYYVISGGWSPHGLVATLDEAIDYLTLSLTRGSLVPEDYIS